MSAAKNNASKASETKLDEDLEFLRSLDPTLLAWIPVEFVDNSDVTHEVVVVSKPMLQCFLVL